MVEPESGAYNENVCYGEKPYEPIRVGLGDYGLIHDAPRRASPNGNEQALSVLRSLTERGELSSEPAEFPDRPRVVVCTPCYGACSVNYAQSFYGASKRRDLLTVVCGIQPNSSLLPTAFNECLARALTLRDEGKATHMAMLHSDITAAPGWLDTLWAEMWEHNAMFMGTNIAIKAPGGRTSTGIGTLGNRWRVHRCVHLNDLAKLPPTFGPEHVCAKGEVLLANTGCWLTDLRHPFWDHFITQEQGRSGFNLHSRIISVKTPSGGTEYGVETRSEDWELSHDMAECGTRYMITQRVRAWHEGGGRWPNFVEN